MVSTPQAGKLAGFSKYGKALGNGLVLVDVGSRIGNVHNAYKADGDWERELFIESSSFATSATAGILTAKAGVAMSSDSAQEIANIPLPYKSPEIHSQIPLAGQ